MWVGIPKDAICWKADRDLLDFLNHSILEYNGKDEVPQHRAVVVGPSADICTTCLVEILFQNCECLEKS